MDFWQKGENGQICGLNFRAKTPCFQAASGPKSISFFSYIYLLVDIWKAKRTLLGNMFKSLIQNFWPLILISKSANLRGKSRFLQKTTFAETAVSPRLIYQNRKFFGVFLVIHVPNFWHIRDPEIPKFDFWSICTMPNHSAPSTHPHTTM